MIQNEPQISAQLRRELEAANQRIAELEAEIAGYDQSQAALVEAEQRYQSLFEQFGDSIMLIDLATNRIVEANANAARRLEYEVDELTQLTLDDIEVLHTPDDNGSDFAWHSYFSGTFVYECYHRHKGGSLVQVEVSSRPVKIGGRDFLQYVVRDNTRRKEIEAEREQLIVELNAFAHTVAHDLKSPLAVVGGYAEMLADDYKRLAPEQLDNALAIVARMSRKMGTIVDELLLLASTRDLAEIPLEPLNMESILNEVLARLTPLIKQREAQVIWPESGWPTAYGYGPWLEEVWVNYLSNAIKYGGTPPILTLGTAVTAEGMVRFCVSDNGPGVPPEKRSLLFTEFQRLGKTQLDGHGLGLWIVQRIITRLGGEVGVAGHEGEGSTFFFTLPRERP